MSYLDQIVAQIAAKHAGSGLHQNPRNSLYDILQGKLEGSAAQNAEWKNLQPRSTSGGGGIGGAAKGAWNAIGSAVDFVERPFYGIEGGALQTLDPHHNKLQDVLGAAWQGLSGQTHHTTSDFTAALAKQNNAGGAFVRTINEAGPFAKLAMNMGPDIALDPLSYVPGADIAKAARVGTRAAFGAVGKDLPKVLEQGGVKAAFRTKNPLKGPQEKVVQEAKVGATPEQVAVDSLDTTGMAKVNSTVADKAVAKFNEPQLPGFEPGSLTPASESNIAKLTARDKTLALQPGQGLLAPSPATDRFNTAQAALAAHKAKAAEILAPFEHARYDPNLEVHPYHMIEPGVPKKVLQDVQKTREIVTSGTPSQEVKKGIQDIIHPETYDSAGKAFATFDQNGVPFDVGGVPVDITPKHLHELATKGGEVPFALRKAHLQTADGKFVPVHRVVKMLQDRAETAKLLGKQTKTETYTAKDWVEQPTTRQRKLTPLERVVWEQQHAKTLHPEDLATLRKAGMKSTKQFNEALAAVKNTMDSTQYNSLEELSKAITDGTAPQAVQDQLKKRLGRTKLETVIKNLAASEQRVAGHTGKQLEAEAKAYAKTPLSKLEEKKGLPSPEGDPQVITDAANIVEKSVDTGAPAKPSIADPVPIDAWQSDTVTNAVRNSFKSEFGDPATWEHMSKTGARMESPNYYEKRARWLEGFNKRSSIGIVKDLVESVTKRLETSGLKGKAYSSAKYDTLMPMLRASEQVMRNEGIQPILGGGRYGKGIPMSMHDVLDSLPRDYVEKYFFDQPFKGQSWNFAPTQIADIAEQFVHLQMGNKTLPAVEEAVRKILQAPLNKAGYKSPLTQKLGRLDRNKKDRVEPMVKATMNAFTEAMPKLDQLLKENIAKTAMDEHGMAKAITDKAIADYSRIVNDPRFSPGMHIQAAVDRHKFVDAAAKGANINPASAAKDLAHQAMDAHVAETTPIAAVKVTEKSTKEMKAAETSNEAVQALVTRQKAEQDEVTAMIARDDGNYYDNGDKAELGLAMGFARAFVPDIGSEAVHRDWLNYHSTAQSYVKDHAQLLSQIHAKYPGKQGEQEIEAGWRQLQNWEPGMLSTPVMDDLMAATKDTLETVPNARFGFFTRNIHDPALLTGDYKHFHVPEGVVLNPENLDESWRTWEPGDKGVLDMLSRVNAAHTYAVAKHTMGADLTARLAFDGPAPGRVKIIDSTGRSEIAKYIDTSKWWDEDHARMLHMLDETMIDLKNGMQGGKLGRKLRNLDIATQMFKAGVTIYRPGHHTRNAIGDIWLASMDGVTPKYYARSSKVLLANKAADHSFDALRSLAPVGGADNVKGLLSLTYKGETRNFTEQQVYQMMKMAGGLPTFDIIEDVSLKSTELDPRLATGIVGKIQAKAHLPGPLEGKAHKVATGVSENREHWIRIAHWLHAMENAPLKGKTFDEAIKNATLDSVSRVRKWHPDGSDLSKFERQYMRRIVPFYSWIRKAIPLVIETAVTQPGKVMLYPKAMYNWAEARGIDLQSYGNPFPTDQLFPSWISDQTQGPVWGATGAYAGINPGIPSADVADQYLANPGQLKNTVLGSLNPLARIPIELMSGTKLRTGGPIGDKTDYIDQQLPMGSYIDQLAGGRSVSSGFTQPNYVAPSNVGYQNPSMPPGPGFLNWLTGLGITDFSKPSYTKFAQLEQKKAAKGG